MAKAIKYINGKEILPKVLTPEWRTNVTDDQWRSQKFSTGGALISGFPSYPHNPLMIYLIHYVTKYFSEK